MKKMADDILQVFSDGRVDAKSLSDFMLKPANAMVSRRLAQPINTINYFLQYFSGISSIYTQSSGSVTVAGQAHKTIGQIAIDATNTVNAAIKDVAIDANLVTDALIKTVPIAPDAIARNQASINAESINVLDFGAKVAPFDSTSAFKKAIDFANGRQVNVPEGLFILTELTAAKARLVGAGKDLTELRLGNSDLSMLVIDELRASNLTMNDNGRPDIARNLGAALCLMKCVNILDINNVKIMTDRTAFTQYAISDSSYTRVDKCDLIRATPSQVGDVDNMNLFVVDNSSFVNLNRVVAKDIVARTVLSSTYRHTDHTSRKAVTTIVNNCSFDGFRNNEIGVTARVLFIQGYLTAVQSNQFRDCFSRHIDVLGTNPANGVYYKALISHNKVDYSVEKQNTIGSEKDSVGSIYCRYSDVHVSGNHMDFTNLLITSAIFVGINIRHGFKAADIFGNTIINPKANGIAVDISDAIETEDGVVNIYSNSITQATNAARPPILIGNNSALKQFKNVNIYNNSMEYSASRAPIYISSALDPSRTSDYSIESLLVHGNRETRTGELDVVDFGSFPKHLYAPNTAVDLKVNPSGVKSEGIIGSFDSAFSILGNYNCKKIDMGLAPSVTTTQSVSTPSNIYPLAKTVNIIGDNSKSGRLRFYAAGTVSANVPIVLSGNTLNFDKCIFNSDPVTSKTMLVYLRGNGFCSLKDCEAQYGHVYVDSGGVDFAITGGTINDINLGNASARAVVRSVSKDRAIKISITDVTGANNTNLYNLLAPATLIYQDIEIGTILGSKSFTTVS